MILIVKGLSSAVHGWASVLSHITCSYVTSWAIHHSPPEGIYCELSMRLQLITGRFTATFVVLYGDEPISKFV